MMRLCYFALISCFVLAISLNGCSKSMAPTEILLPDGISASIKITDKVLNTVNPLIFGDNIEWVNDGMGVWIPKENRFDDEIVKEFKALGITHLRYPGGTLSDCFDWYDAIGKERKPIPNPFREYKKEYPYFGPEEFMELCRKLEIPGTITFNAGTGKPEDATKWAEYIKKENFNVTSFTVGNEIYLAKSDDPMAKTTQQYIDFFLKCKEGLDKVVPDVKLGVISLHDSRYAPIKENRKWMKDVLTALGDKIDFVDVHNSYAPLLRGVGINNKRYSDDDFALCFAGASVHVQKEIDFVKEDIAKYAPNNEKNIDINITEYGPLVYPLKKEKAIEDISWNRTLSGALYLACLYNVFLKEPKLTSANHLPLCQDVFAALVGINGTYPNRKIWRNAVYYVFQPYASMAGRDVMETVVECPAYSVPAMGFVSKMDNVPYVDVGAYRKNGNELTIFLVNRSIKNNANVKIDPGFAKFKVVSTTIMTSDSYKDENNSDKPNKVIPVAKPEDRSIHNGTLEITLPKHSFTVINVGGI